MARRTHLGKIVCHKCGEPLIQIIPDNSLGNYYGQIWLPCENKDCPEFGKEVEISKLADSELKSLNY